jgi:hypothetical protein
VTLCSYIRKIKTQNDFISQTNVAKMFQIIFVVILFVSIVDCSVCKYYNPEILVILNTDNRFDTRITCYVGLSFEVCPDIDDEPLIHLFETRYNNGYYIDKNYYFLNDDDVDDVSICNEKKDIPILHKRNHIYGGPTGM